LREEEADRVHVMRVADPVAVRLRPRYPVPAFRAFAQLEVLKRREQDLALHVRQQDRLAPRDRPLPRRVRAEVFAPRKRILTLALPPFLFSRDHGTLR